MGGGRQESSVEEEKGEAVRGALSGCHELEGDEREEEGKAARDVQRQGRGRRGGEEEPVEDGGGGDAARGGDGERDTDGTESRER